jgi:hypothetical protein
MQFSSLEYVDSVITLCRRDRTESSAARGSLRPVDPFLEVPRLVGREMDVSEWWILA